MNKQTTTAKGRKRGDKAVPVSTGQANQDVFQTLGMKKTKRGSAKKGTKGVSATVETQNGAVEIHTDAGVAINEPTPATIDNTTPTTVVGQAPNPATVVRKSALKTPQMMASAKGIGWHNKAGRPTRATTVSVFGEKGCRDLSWDARAKVMNMPTAELVALFVADKAECKARWEAATAPAPKEEAKS